MIDSPGKVPSFANKAAYQLHEELRLHIRHSILAGPAQIVLRKVKNLAVPQEVFSHNILSLSSNSSTNFEMADIWTEASVSAAARSSSPTQNVLRYQRKLPLDSNALPFGMYVIT